MRPFVCHKCTEMNPLWDREEGWRRLEEEGAGARWQWPKASADCPVELDRTLECSKHSTYLVSPISDHSESRIVSASGCEPYSQGILTGLSTLRPDYTASLVRRWCV